MAKKSEKNFQTFDNRRNHQTSSVLFCKTLYIEINRHTLTEKEPLQPIVRDLPSFLIKIDN